MSKQTVAIILLVTIAVLLGAGALLVPFTSTPTRPTESSSTRANIALVPQEKEATVGGTIAFDIMPRNLSQKVSGLDLLLTIDPSLVDFKALENVPEGYIKGRALIENNTLIISIIESISTTQTATATPQRLGTIVFQAKKAGSVQVKPVITTGTKSSILLLGDSLDNALTGITSPTILIRP